MVAICVVISPEANKIIKNIYKKTQCKNIDNVKFYTDKNIALGNIKLNTHKLKVQKQLISNENDTIWITFIGEIYNKKQISQQLEKKHIFKTNSSAEVIIHSYEEYNFSCLNIFNGMFAFCLWDTKKRLIFTARDRLGMKSIYYYHYKDLVILASEIKNILAEPSVPRKPNNRFIYEYLINSYPKRKGNTFFSGIKELMPAHYMIIKNKEIVIQKYWDPKQNSKSISTTKDNNWYSSEFLKLLRDSISIRLPKNRTIGTFLSGGLDSTSITFIIDNFLKSNHYNNVNKQEIFSAIYKESPEQGDEKYYIKEVEHLLQTKINYVFPTVINEWESLKKFIFSIEEPVAVFNYYVFWCLFQNTVQKVNIIYIGQGADALLGGSISYSLIYFKELWNRKNICTLLNDFIKSLDWLILWMIWSIFFEKKGKTKVKKLLSLSFLKNYNQIKLQKENVTLKNAIINEIKHHVIEYLRVDDRISSINSIESRHPFLDHRLVEFALSLPENQMIRNGWTKYILRNSMKGIIPESIRLKRKKTGTPIPQQRWMNELQLNIRKLLESNDFRKRGYFNQPAILDVFDRYCDDKLGRVERESYANFLWRVINLELWFKAYFD
ncbi:MAG: asparagine synthase (glutamine-hydrolyzing) [Candidatus Hodarchaeota archaeon]